MQHRTTKSVVKSTTTTKTVVKSTTTTEVEIMRRYRLIKSAVLPSRLRNILLERAYPALRRDICNSGFGRAVGRDEAASVVNEVATLTARTFDPTKYKNPLTGRPFDADDVEALEGEAGKTELDRLFGNYLRMATNCAVKRSFEKRGREVPSGSGRDYAANVEARGWHDPSDRMAAREQLDLHGSFEAAMGVHRAELACS